MSAPLSPEAMAAIQAAAAPGLSSLRADAPQTLSEWAAEHFLLAGESSHQKGGWVGWPKRSVSAMAQLVRSLPTA